MKELFYAEIIDNNDTELQAGRVKIKIPHLHDAVGKDLLPWAKQMSLFSGGASTHGSSNIPEIGGWVWVMFENETDYLKPFYIADVHLNEMNPHLLFKSDVASTIGTSSNYPDVKFKYYKNGICVGASSNSDTPELFFYHPKGTFGVVDKDGNIKITDANGNTVVTSSTKITFNSNLEVLQ